MEIEVKGSRLILNLGVTLHDAERRVIEATMAYVGDNKQDAADTLGVCVDTLDKKLAQYAHADKEEERTKEWRIAESQRQKMKRRAHFPLPSYLK